jgi:hypothetical protein
MVAQRVAAVLAFGVAFAAPALGARTAERRVPPASKEGGGGTQRSRNASAHLDAEGCDVRAERVTINSSGPMTTAKSES